MTNSTVDRGSAAAGHASPALAFSIDDADVAEFAAVPTLRFALRIESPGEEPIRCIALAAQVRIAAAQRLYDAATQDRLVEVFGAPGQWGRSLRSLLWTHAAVQVPPFAGSTRVELPVSCTYDFEVVAAKYFHALHDGEVPLEFLFSGTVFYGGEDGSLRVGRISWDQEARFRLPIRVWKELMERYFPDSAWIRLRKDAFDRLYAYKARRALPTWEDTLDALLRGSEAES